ncbi:hypothetical protein VTK73DRAFT_10375 [Phialemonium thermophilum]|uniref:N-acetyltransferase domain-containing protein n=1 Tax=Phialemonium thermophilum TaxID=223376 RepID=A0ABR3VX16_9PEZI
MLSNGLTTPSVAKFDVRPRKFPSQRIATSEEHITMAGPSEMQNCRTQPTVRFAPVSEVAAVEPTSNRSPTRARTTRYETFSGAQMTDDMCAEAAKLFSEHYGMWGQRSSKPGEALFRLVSLLSFLLTLCRKEEPVTLGASRLRQQYMPAGADCSYVRVVVDGVLAGHAFVCRWEQGGSTVCWITQLVVRREYRERGLASGLLASLRASPDDVYGIVSSHPAACLATATVLGGKCQVYP